MSARKSIYSIEDQGCDGGVSPNAYVPRITAEIRVHYPPNTVTEEEVVKTLLRSYARARTDIREFFRKRESA